MATAFKIYSSRKTKETYIEVWGASTKHPDLMKAVVHDNPYFDDPCMDLVQTLLLMGSECLFPFHVEKYINEAMRWLDVIKDMRRANELAS